MKNVVKTAVDEAVEIAIDERNIEIAKNMLADNETDAKIIKYTGLTLAQLQELRKSMK
jgi:hypothetical protein